MKIATLGIFKYRLGQLPTLAAIVSFLVAASQKSFSAEPVQAPGRVVLNEIMYHPPDDRDDLQFVELANTSREAVDLSGWTPSKGFDFTFPKGSELAAGGYVVLCRDAVAFNRHYGTNVPVAGIFKGKLSHNGERLELADAQGQKVDSIKYSDQSPWPMGADGYGASLERICFKEASDDAANWASSVARSRDRASGTPGSRNSSFSDSALPRVVDVRFDKAEPNRPVVVTASVADSAGVEAVSLTWWAAAANQQGASKAELPMKLTSGDAKQGVYSASIPAQPENRLVRFEVRARGTSGKERLHPSPTEPRPSLSYSTFLNKNNAQVPFLQVLTMGAMEAPGGRSSSRRRSQDRTKQSPDSLNSGGSAVIYMPPGGKEAILFDHARVRPRKGGWKIHFLKDQTLDGMTGINIIFEDFPRFVLAEALAFQLYRAAGVPAPLGQHMRIWVDGQQRGYYLVVEQPNKSFLKRNGRDEDGNLYKIVWAGQGITGQHEKKTNPANGHGDVTKLINALDRTSGLQQWELIQQNFNVDEVASYFAVNMCIQNWDGFFNNYYAYHDLKPGGKWEMFPWDEDKTWGYYDGGPGDYDWYSMPLTTGMKGDSQPSRSFFGGGGGPYGGPGWWRPPGWFSGPLLANREFRQRFEARLREICATVFTPEKMEPVFKTMETRLEPEIRVRAKLTGENPESAVESFHSDMNSFRQQVVNRRKYILKEIGTKP